MVAGRHWPAPVAGQQLTGLWASRVTGDWHGEPASSPPATCVAVLLGDAERRRAMGERAVAEAARDGVRESESASLFFFFSAACLCLLGLGRSRPIACSCVGRVGHLGYATAYPGHPLGPLIIAVCICMLFYLALAHQYI